MMQTLEGQGVDRPIAPPAPVGDFGHLDLDAAMEHARRLRLDHLRWMAIQVTGRYRYVRFRVRRALYSPVRDRADPAR